MRTGRAGPRWGCVASGEEWENSLLESVNRGWVKGGGLAYPASSSNSWSTLDPPPPRPGPPCSPGTVLRLRVCRALPSGAARARPEGSGSAYLRALGPAAKAGGKLPRPAGEHRCGRRCGLAVRVHAGASVCAPVYAPGGPAGGVRRASPPVSGRRCRRRPHLQEAHRWLLVPTLTEPPLSICTPF